MKTELKLFIWDKFEPDWVGGDGLAFAIAKDEQEAKKLIKKEYRGIFPIDWGTFKIKPLTIRIARCVSGGA